MYIPVQQRAAGKRLTPKQRSQRSKLGIWLACLVLLIGTGWGVWQSRSSTNDEMGTEQALHHDLQLLWGWSDTQLTGGGESGVWSIRWDATGDRGLADRLVERFFTDKDGMQLDKLVQNDGRTVSGDIAGYGGHVSISLMEADDRHEKVLLLFTMSDKAAINQGEASVAPTVRAEKGLNGLLHAEAALSEALVEEKADFTASMKVQGLAAMTRPVEELVKRTNAALIDSYEEGGTESATLYSGNVRAQIEVGGGELANVQIAVRKQTDGEPTAITIGIPLITGDYAVSQPSS